MMHPALRELLFGAGGLFRPDQAPSRVAWYNPMLGVTMGGTPLASGAAPPVVTFTGTLTQPLGLQVAIDSVAGGTARGQATLKWSLDNGSTFQQTGVVTAATVVLGTTGVTANFPVGTYATDQKWDAVASSWDRIGQSTLALTQATASKQFKIIASAQNGRFGFRSEATRSCFMQASLTFNQPREIWAVAKWDDAFSANSTLLDGVGGNSSRMFRTSGAQVSLFSGAQLNAGSVTPTAYHVHRCVFNDTSSAYYEDGVQKAAGAAGAAASSGFTIGSFGSGAADFANATFLELALFNAALNSTHAAKLLSYLRIAHGL